MKQEYIVGRLCICSFDDAGRVWTYSIEILHMMAFVIRMFVAREDNNWQTTEYNIEYLSMFKYDRSCYF